jgi:hypothetical protein
MLAHAIRSFSIHLTIPTAVVIMMQFLPWMASMIMYWRQTTVEIRQSDVKMIDMIAIIKVSRYRHPDKNIGQVRI